MTMGMQTTVDDAETSARATSVGERLRASLVAIEKAARSAGIEADDPLGVWIDTLRTGLGLFADLSIQNEERVMASLVAMKEAAQEDTRKMRAAAAECEMATRKLEATYGTMEVRSHNLISQTIASMAGQVADRMRDRMVIVERLHNRVALWKRAGVLTALVVVIFGVGFGAARYVDGPAVRMLEHCTAHPMVNSETGGLVCAMDAPRSGG